MRCLSLNDNGHICLKEAKIVAIFKSGPFFSPKYRCWNHIEDLVLNGYNNTSFIDTKVIE